MIGFIVAFRPRQNSKDWNNDSTLLRKTLISICNQTSENFRVYVVHHELPEEIYTHHNLKYIKFPYEFCKLEQLTEKTEYQLNDPIMTVNGFDQGKKTMYGASEAINDGCKFIMSVDADDLISNKIAEYVTAPSRENSDGWYIDKGYVYVTNKSFLLRKPSKMNTINASTNIIASKHIPQLDFNSTKADLFSFFAAHGYLYQRLREQGININPLPFYGVIYVAHSSNWTNIQQSLSKFSLRNLLLRILRYQRKKASIRKEFSIE